AGIEKARAIIVCTNDDLVNLQVISRIRELNKDIRVVMRMFDDQFARSIAENFNISAVFSASAMAAPACAGAATSTEIMHSFTVADRVLVMGRLDVQPGSRLDGASVAEVEREFDLSVIMVQNTTTVDVHPAPEVRLHVGDSFAVISDAQTIRDVSSRWNKPGGR
ncbi:MAG: NAD-binding protein, partial [Anaerolineae bacterium]|nr:NAD-binding protein [Anaerolineae bacterium]